MVLQSQSCWPQELRPLDTRKKSVIRKERERERERERDGDMEMERWIDGKMERQRDRERERERAGNLQICMYRSARFVRRQHFRSCQPIVDRLGASWAAGLRAT